MKDYGVIGSLGALIDTNSTWITGAAHDIAADDWSTERELGRKETTSDDDENSPTRGMHIITATNTR